MTTSFDPYLDQGRFADTAARERWVSAARAAIAAETGLPPGHFLTALAFLACEFIGEVGTQIPPAEVQELVAEAIDRLGPEHALLQLAEAAGRTIEALGLGLLQAAIEFEEVEAAQAPAPAPQTTVPPLPLIVDGQVSMR